jgi:hypothetical protein
VFQRKRHAQIHVKWQCSVRRRRRTVRASFLLVLLHTLQVIIKRLLLAEEQGNWKRFG